MDHPVSKSALTKAQRDLIDLFQQNPFSRIEHLFIRCGEPVLTPSPTVVQKFRMGGDNKPRPESGLSDFWLKKPIIEFLEIIAGLGEGEIKSIEIAHGLPLLVEIERRIVSEGESENV